MLDKNLWDSSYKNGDFSHWETYYPSPELAALVAAGVIHKKARILDIGSGGGLDAVFLAECGFNVVGLDFSKSALKIAKKRAAKVREKVNWVLASVFNLPICGETVDFVVDRGVFHIIEDVDRSKYVAELFRILQFDGRVVIRGAGEKSAERNRFNPVTEETIDNFFPKSKFQRGPVLPIPLSSSAGVLEANIIIIKKTEG